MDLYGLPFPALSRDNLVLAWTALPWGDYSAIVELYRTWTGKSERTLMVHMHRYERTHQHLVSVLVRHDLRPMTRLERTDVRELPGGAGYVDEWRGPDVRVEYWTPEAAATDPVAWVRSGEAAKYTVAELETGRVRRRGSIRPRRPNGRGVALMDPATVKIPRLPSLQAAYQSEDGRIVVLVFGECDCACNINPFPVIARW